MKKLKFNIRKIKIGILYTFLALGGLWHILGKYQFWMDLLAGPVMAGIGIWIFFETLPKSKIGFKFIIFSIFVVAASWLVEFIGVKTGMIFGVYEYGPVLKPKLLGVPVSIGFAWIGTILASAAIAQSMPFLKYNSVKDFVKAGQIAFFMTLFDFLMEPAAVYLNYWTWENVTPPLINYAGWYIFSYIFAYIGLKMGLLKQQFPLIARHFYYSQIMYFLLVYIR